MPQCELAIGEGLLFAAACVLHDNSLLLRGSLWPLTDPPRKRKANSRADVARDCLNMLKPPISYYRGCDGREERSSGIGGEAAGLRVTPTLWSKALSAN